mgnify:FL=1
MKLAIYDFDGTYVNLQTLPFLYKLWKAEGINNRTHRLIWRKITLRYLLHKLHLFGWTKQRFRADAMAQTADLFRLVERLVLDDFLQTFHDRLQPFVSTRMRDQLIRDHEDGYVTVLLSGNYDIILEPFLSDGFDHVVGTPLTTNEGLKSSDNVDIIIHQRKADVIRKLFPTSDFAASKAYADSHYDMPIFDLVGHPIAVNPDDKLYAHALAHGYEIITVE